MNQNEIISILESLSGPLDISLVNDYLFRALLQKNNNVLKALIASLLHMNLSDIKSVKIENEIVLGEQTKDKEFILDIRIMMNNNTIINLEMQVINYHNWPERSMSYLSRTFDNLAHGEDYIKVKPTIQIGLLDYTLFPEAPEFYANYYLMNEKTYQKYSDKLRISVVDLTQIDLATEEDKAYGIDHWAALFKSQTWEELKMLAKNNDSITDAVSTIYDITQDSVLREEIRAREERLALENRLKQEAVAMQEAIDDLKEKNAEMEEQNAIKDKRIAELEAQLKELQSK